MKYLNLEPTCTKLFSSQYKASEYIWPPFPNKSIKLYLDDDIAEL